MPALYRKSSSIGSKDAFLPIPILSSHKGQAQNDIEEYEAVFKLKAEL